MNDTVGGMCGDVMGNMVLTLLTPLSSYSRYISYALVTGGGNDFRPKID